MQNFARAHFVRAHVRACVHVQNSKEAGDADFCRILSACVRA